MRARKNARPSKTTTRAARLAEIAGHGRRRSGGPAPEMDRCTFLEAFYHGASDEDLADSPELLAAAALDQLDWAGKRQPGRPKVRVFNPTEAEHGWTSPCTIVETLTDDSPFLVDSVSMQISSLGYRVASNVHPVLAIEWGLNTPIKEEGDMRIFLGFCYA